MMVRFHQRPLKMSKNYDIYDEEYTKVLDGKIEHEEAVSRIASRTGESEREVEMEVQAAVDRATLVNNGLR